MVKNVKVKCWFSLQKSLCHYKVFKIKLKVFCKLAHLVERRGSKEVNCSKGGGAQRKFFFRGGEIHLSFLVKCPFKDFYIYILKIYILHTLNSNVARRSNSKRYFNSKRDKAFCYICILEYYI